MVKKFRSNDGSLTLEACIVVPIFVMLMLLVNGLFVMMMGEQIMSHALVQSAKSMALDPYASSRVAAGAEQKLGEMFVDVFSVKGISRNYASTEKWYDKEAGSDVADLAKKRFVAYLRSSETDADALLDELGVKNGTAVLDFSGTTYSDGILTISVTYTQEYVYNAFDLASFQRNKTAQVRVFEYKSE